MRKITTTLLIALGLAAAVFSAAAMADQIPGDDAGSSHTCWIPWLPLPLCD